MTLKASCFDCVYVRSSRYYCQGDSGSDVSCTHPEAQERGVIGDTTWDTPKWCPLLAAAVAAAWGSRGVPRG